ncbi:hypothetical protein UlMin_027836 [Ulmus minor]
MQWSEQIKSSLHRYPYSWDAYNSSKKPLLEAEEMEEGKQKKEKEEARPVTYSYMFFHLIFALASMYSAMLLSGGPTHLRART